VAFMKFSVLFRSTDAKPIAFRALLQAVLPYVNSLNVIRGSIYAMVRLLCLCLDMSVTVSYYYSNYLVSFFGFDVTFDYSPHSEDV